MEEKEEEEIKEVEGRHVSVPMNSVRRTLLMIAVGAWATLLQGAEPKVVALDWEQACGGSSVVVTTVADELVTIEAFAEHFAEAREWVCAFSEGTLVSATFRHYVISRKPRGDNGDFAIERTVDQVSVFAPRNGTLEDMEEGLRKDLESVIALAKSSLGKER